MATLGELESIIVRAFREKEERRVWADIILRCLRLRFGHVPEDLVESLSTYWELKRLGAFFDASVTEGSLDDFRRLTAL